MKTPPPAMDLERFRRLGHELVDLVTDYVAAGAAFLTQTTLRGRFALRACVLHYATTEEDVATLVDVVRATGARLVAAAR